jgi:hypothetical protein
VKVKRHLDKATVVLKRDCAAKNCGVVAANEFFCDATARYTAHDVV